MQDNGILLYLENGSELWWETPGPLVTKVIKWLYPFTHCLLHISQKSFILPTKAVNQLLLLDLGLKYACLIITELAKANCWKKLLKVLCNNDYIPSLIIRMGYNNYCIG